MRYWTLMLAFACCLAAALGCSEKEGVKWGELGQPCYPDGRCHQGLICVENRCEAPVEAGLEDAAPDGPGTDGPGQTDGPAKEAGGDAAPGDAKPGEAGPSDAPPATG